MQLLNWKCHFCSMPEFLHPGGSWGSAGAFPWIFFSQGLPFVSGSFSHPKFPSPPPLLFLSEQSSTMREVQKSDFLAFSIKQESLWSPKYLFAICGSCCEGQQSWFVPLLLEIPWALSDQCCKTTFCHLFNIFCLVWDFFFFSSSQKMSLFH